jgi:hypothetical protein
MEIKYHNYSLHKHGHSLRMISDLSELMEYKN